jgi:hypothetical protein
MPHFPLEPSIPEYIETASKLIDGRVFVYVTQTEVISNRRIDGGRGEYTSGRIGRARFSSYFRRKEEQE